MNDAPDALHASRRLTELLRHEHDAMADFLVALADFDRQRLWVQLGHASLFYYLHRELGLSTGAAHFRKVAVRLIQHFPEVVEPLRDGRLCLTSVVELARVITEENRAEVIPRFFHRSKREAKAVAAEIRPAEVIPRREVVTEVVTGVLTGVLTEVVTGVSQLEPHGENAGASAPGPSREPFRPDETVSTHLVRGSHPREPLQIQPLTPELRRLHVTVSKQLLEKLDRARTGQSHVQPGASTEQVLDAALDLLLAQQEKRRRQVPPAVKRAVWARDKGRCQWPVEGGGTCDSKLCLEIDHVIPRARGGPSTVENCRLVCRFHNQLAARQAFGDDWMDRFTDGARVRGGPGAAASASATASA
jgi:5-methylcytosine-specific restriction endonuclease McrA